MLQNILNLPILQAQIDMSMAGFLAPIIAMFMAFFVFGLIAVVLLYVYNALVFQTIAKKLNYDKPWLAWIPVANLFLYPILAKKHWAMGFLFLVPVVNMVFYFIWLWKIFELRKYPAWLSLTPLLTIIPVINVVVVIAFLVLLGFVAWKDRN
jgi:hypothetical protein